MGWALAVACLVLLPLGGLPTAYLAAAYLAAGAYSRSLQSST